MKKKIIIKATSILLVSQFLISTTSLTAKAEGDLKPITDIKKKFSTGVPVPDLPTFPITKFNESESNEIENSSTSDNEEDDYSIIEGNKINDTPILNNHKEVVNEYSVEDTETNKLEEAIETSSSEGIIEYSENVDGTRELKNDGVAVVVKNDVEFRAALTNTTITHIHLANDLTMTASTSWLGSTKIIEGDNHTLTFARNVNLKGATANQGLNLSNIRIIADVANTITQSSTSSVSLENVTYVNSQITGRFLLLSGTNSSINIAGNNIFNGGAFIQGSSFVMELHNFATLKVNNNGTARSIYSSSAGKINLDPGSTLDITQNNPSNTDKAVLLATSNSVINVSKDATLKITSAPDTNKTEEALGLRGSLNVANNGTLDILGRSVYSTLNIGEASTFQEGSNIRIQNNHTNGSAIGSYPGVTQYNFFSSQGFQTWARGANLAGDPTFNYSNFTQGSFSLNGYRISQVTSNIVSNDFQFNATFNSSNTAKIVTGNYNVSFDIAQTTINGLDSSSTAVTGTGEPNADISILNGSSLLATGRVGSDGIYSLTIAPQALGDIITASVNLNGLTSEASTIVGQSQIDLQAPELQPMFVDDSFVSGTVAGIAEFVAIYINGVHQQTETVNVDRSFSIYTGDYNLVAGQIIQVAAVTKDSANGQIIDEGPRTDITILDRFVAPTINTVHDDDKTVDGAISGTARFVSVYINEKIIQTAAVNADRTYSINISNQTLVAGQNIQVAGVTFDEENSSIIDEGPKTSATVIGSEQLVAPIVNPVFVGDEFVRGTVGGTASFVAIYKHTGELLRTAAVAADRSYEIYIGDYILTGGQPIQVSAVIKENNNGPIVTVGPKTITQVQDLFEIPFINYVNIGDAYVHGTIGGTAQFVGLYIGGQLIRTAAVNSDRTYTIYIGDCTLVAGQVIEIAGVTRDSSTGLVIAIGHKAEGIVSVISVDINRYVLGQDLITGTISIGTSKVFLEVDGVQVRRGQVETNGDFSIWASDFITSVSQKVEIVVVTASQIEIGRFPVTVNVA